MEGERLAVADDADVDPVAGLGLGQGVGQVLQVGQVRGAEADQAVAAGQAGARRRGCRGRRR